MTSQSEDPLPNEQNVSIALKRPPHPNFWWAIVWWLGLIIGLQLVPGLIVGVIFVVNAVVTDPALLRDPNLAESPEFKKAMLIGLVVGQFCSIGFAWLALRFSAGPDWPRLVALRLPSGSQLILTALALPALMITSIGVDSLIRRVVPAILDVDEMMRGFSQWPLAVGILAIGIGPGINEELWFRGFFGRGLVARYGVVVGILMTSFLFGLIHIDPRHAAIAMYLGICLHLSYLATRSLVVPMLLHFGNNSLSLLAARNPIDSVVQADASDLPWILYAAAVVLVIATSWVAFQIRPKFVGPSGELWRPDFPGVEYPPPEFQAEMIRPVPGRSKWIMTAACSAVFVAACAEASRQYEFRPPQNQHAIELVAPAIAEE